MPPPPLDQLPQPPPGKTGWPWDVASPRPQTTDCTRSFPLVSVADSPHSGAAPRPTPVLGYRLQTSPRGTRSVESTSVHSVDSVQTPGSRHSHLGTQALKHLDTGNLPKISIVTPSFNQGQFIEETIRSVLLQGYPNLEYIIIDGGSTDNTVEIIKKYEPWLTYWVSEKDKGQSHAINKGWKMATGDILGWINSDDWLLPGALADLAVAFNANPISGIIYGQCRYLDANGTIADVMPCLTEVNLAHLIQGHTIPQPATFVTGDVYRKFGPLREDLHYVFDYEYWIRVAQSCTITSHPGSLAAFRLHPMQKTNKLVGGWSLELLQLLHELKRNGIISSSDLLVAWRRNLGYVHRQLAHASRYESRWYPACLGYARWFWLTLLNILDPRTCLLFWQSGIKG